MSKPKIIEVEALNLRMPSNGMDVETDIRLRVERDVMPIVFVPGIMGSRLKNKQGRKVWDPDAKWFMLRNYGILWLCNAEKRKALLVGAKFDPEHLQVLNDDKAHNKKFADKYDRDRAKRGWGGVSWSSYGDIIKKLHLREWDRTVDLFYDFSVHVFGYNWSASNDLAGEKLAREIDRIIQHYKDMGRHCDKVILVTHSMGGLVARSACMLHGAMDKVLGVIHGVQPWEGAPAAYWRMKGGFERPHTVPDGGFMQWFRNPLKMLKHKFKNTFEGEGVGIPYTKLKVSLGTVTAWTLGTNGEEVTSLLGNMPGGLELLPNKQYKTNDGNTGWLELPDGAGEKTLLPRSGNPYYEIYRVQEVYYRLINPDWLNPGEATTPDDFEKTPWEHYKTYLDQAETFHEKLGHTNPPVHPETYQFYSSGIASADRVVFTSAEDTLWESVKRKFGILAGDTVDEVKGYPAGMARPAAWQGIKTLVFSTASGGVNLVPNLIEVGTTLISSAMLKDSDWHANRGGYRERVNDKNIPTKAGKLQLVTMQLPDGAGDGTVPDSSGRSYKVGHPRVYCIGDRHEFDMTFIGKNPRLQPKHKPDFDECYFDRDHEGIYKSSSAQFITFTEIENMCIDEIERRQAAAKGGKS